MGKTKKRREERKREEKVRRKRTKKKRKEKTKKEENDGSKKGSRRVGNRRQGRGDSKVRRRKKDGTKMFLQVDSYFWQESQWKDAYQEVMRSCYWYEERVCIEEEEDISIVKRGERRDV